jgi:CBS domain-containing protein
MGEPLSRGVRSPDLLTASRTALALPTPSEYRWAVTTQKEVAMKASDIMRRPVVAATPTATARDVGIQLLMGEFSGVPVAQSDGSVVGVVTELDLIRAVLRAGKALETTLAQDIMTRDVTTVDAETPLEEIMKVLEEKNIIRVPVTDKGKLVGIISRSDVLRAMIEPKFLRFA